MNRLIGASLSTWVCRPAPSVAVGRIAFTAIRRADVDDSAVVGDVLRGTLHGQERIFGVHPEHPVELVLGDVRDGQTGQLQTGVGDDDVDLSERGLRRFEKLRDVIDLADVGLDRDGVQRSLHL